MQKPESLLGMLNRIQILIKLPGRLEEWAPARLPLVALNPRTHQLSCSPKTETVATPLLLLLPLPLTQLPLHARKAGDTQIVPLP